MPAHRRTRRATFLGGFLCAFLVALSIAATYPVIEMGVGDDWSFAKTALIFARTGHIVYNGWAAVMLGWQILWGALFIKLFGYSMLVLRLSTLPLAMACGLLLFWLCTRFGLNWANAFLATCTVVLSPVFLPLATSYMTDIPGVFSILLGLYCCVKTLDEKSSAGAIWWLTIATVSGVIGGTCRQIAWLGPLVMVPSTAWQLRKMRGIVPATVALWVFSVAAIYGCTTWFAHQPYSVPEKLLKSKFQFWLIRKGLEHYRDVILTLFFFSLPALVAYLSAIGRASKKVLIPLLAIAAVVIIITVMRGGNGLAPFMTEMVTPVGVGGTAEWHTLGKQAVVLGPVLRLVLTSLTALALCAAIAVLCSFYPFRQLGKATTGQAPDDAFSWRALVYLFVPFTLAYFILLAPRAIFVNVFDRYLIPLVGLLAIPLLRFYQERINQRTPTVCFIMLALFWAYAVISTHDFFVTDRARLAAAQEVLRAGVPRTELQAGWELDGETQINLAGYMNWPGIQVPPGAYHPFEPSPLLPRACQTQWSLTVPVIHPQYFVVFSPQSCLASSGLPPVSYSTWWPPFQRKIYIQRLPEPYLSNGNSK